MTTLELPSTITERTVPALLDAQADRIGPRTALIAHSLLSGGERRMTYAELRDSADRLAGALAQAGVERGDRVGILLDNDGAIEAHVTYHASHRLGAINVPLNTRYVERELAEVLAFVAPAAIVFAPRFAELLGRLRGSLGSAVLLEATTAEPRLGGSLAEALDAAPIAARVEVGEHDEADWILTSGTTANPKAVALGHAGSVACGHQAVPVWDVDGDSVYMSFAPFFTSTGSHTNLAGRRLHVRDRARVRRARHAGADRQARGDLDVPGQQRAAAAVRPVDGRGDRRLCISVAAAHLLRRAVGSARVLPAGVA
jgi:acyl-CoA synthetase (AMP-forming)/AMP-acid ligase II